MDIDNWDYINFGNFDNNIVLTKNMYSIFINNKLVLRIYTFDSNEIITCLIRYNNYHGTNHQIRNKNVSIKME